MRAEFKTSMYGRAGHLMMAIISVVILLFLGAALALSVVSFNDLWAWLATLSLFLAFAWASIYCLCFACERGKRIVCLQEQLIYRGLIKTTVIPWSEITEFWIDFSGRTPFVFLVLRTKLRRWPYRVNMSGLTPSYVTLFSLVCHMAPHAKFWTPIGYKHVEEAKGEVERSLLEDMVDNSLTFRSSGMPQKRGTP